MSLGLSKWSNPVFAGELENPQFYENGSGHFVNQIGKVTFGWFKTLDDLQTQRYYASINEAVLSAEVGVPVRWYLNNASGSATPVYQRPTGSGYCRRIHITVIAYGVEKLFQQDACYTTSSDSWQWYRG